ncbi:hypothetical protein Droror1_Dr00018792 [Drosera rotundifolia]
MLSLLMPHLTILPVYSEKHAASIFGDDFLDILSRDSLGMSSVGILRLMCLRLIFGLQWYCALAVALLLASRAVAPEGMRRGCFRLIVGSVKYSIIVLNLS